VRKRLTGVRHWFSRCQTSLKGGNRGVPRWPSRS